MGALFTSYLNSLLSLTNPSIFQITKLFPMEAGLYLGCLLSACAAPSVYHFSLFSPFNAPVETVCVRLHSSWSKFGKIFHFSQTSEPNMLKRFRYSLKKKKNRDFRKLKLFRTLNRFNTIYVCSF